ncbi:hypothetical protein H312_02160 [Anncaliia algerae PRA339]|uniref:Uncharacterized protein n=1 Tax=Anncaliia algerae PRA339 TaxID=1288291 RepID=A0A059F0C1_9MICR|nr:hypothetical protein H312_02160 [Anncaliia algerae PRA339]
MFPIDLQFNDFTAEYAEELCLKAKNGELPVTERRLTKLEKLAVQPNTCYIFKKSKIKRWTDGLDWSPSRISNCFLVYKSENLIRKNISFKEHNLSVCAYFPNKPNEKKKLIFNLMNYRSEKFKNFLLNYDNMESVEISNLSFTSKENASILNDEYFYNFRVKRELKLRDQFDDFISFSNKEHYDSENSNGSKETLVSNYDLMAEYDFNKSVF